MNNDINNKYLLFSVDEEYALPLSNVVEIIEMVDMTRVPETPDYISGIINLRGHVVPVIDIRKRFKKPEYTGGHTQCIVITRIDSNFLGLVVDKVIDLIDIEPGKLSASPHLGGSYAHVFIKAIGIYDDKMHLIVDPDRLVNHNDLFFVEDEKAAAQEKEQDSE